MTDTQPLSLELRLQDSLRRAIGELVQRPWTGSVPVEISNRRDLADYAAPMFAVAKEIGRPPLEVATQLEDLLRRAAPDLVEEARAAPPGFLNIRVAGAALASLVQEACDARGAVADQTVGAGVKVVIEHTNVNPNKAAHVGHFRNACIGDTVARLLVRSGHQVEVQNYIDDTGVQVADVVVGLRFLEGRPVQEDGESFDRYCSRVYAAVTEAYQAAPDLVERRREVQRAVESGGSEIADFARDVAQRVVNANLQTMLRAGVEYDLLTWESDILRLGFWEHAFDRLKATKAIELEEDGPNKGTWVLRFGSGTVETEDRTVHEDKVLVTREGIATYTAKDIAYQLWKFALLDRDFGYRLWGTQPSGRELWTTASEQASDRSGADSSLAHRSVGGFGHADVVVNVIDASQSYPQQIVYEGLRRLGFEHAAQASEHLAYGLVSLTAAAARQMGVTVSDDERTVAMKGRAGVQVFADELLDRLETLIAERGEREVPDAAALATAAARYYMLKFSNQQDLAFDFDDALRTTGETGVYLQYAYVRASGILRRLDDFAASDAPDPMPEHDRALVLRMADYPRIIGNAVRERNPSGVAKFSFELASAFSSFYDNTDPVVTESDMLLRRWRGGLVSAFRYVLGDAMEVLGIPRLERI